jgi:hypothetical protein
LFDPNQRCDHALFFGLQETIQKTDANGKLLPEMVGIIEDENAADH